MPIASTAARQPLDVPFVDDRTEMDLGQHVQLGLDEVADGLGQVLVAQDLVALRVDRLALLVDDVVVLNDALADVEVVALDARLGVLDRLGDQPRLDGHVPLEAHALHQAGDAVRGEALHQRVLEGQVEA